MEKPQIHLIWGG